MLIDRLSQRITFVKLMDIQMKLKDRSRPKLKIRWRNRWNWSKLRKITTRGFSNRSKLSRKSCTLSLLYSEQRWDPKNSQSLTPLASRIYLTVTMTQVCLISELPPIELTSRECQDPGPTIHLFLTKPHPQTVYLNRLHSIQISWKSEPSSMK
jgi:hypothetical protein